MFNHPQKKCNLTAYTVKLRRRNEEQTVYTITSVLAESPETAAKIAKKFIAENGFWSACLNTAERMSCLTTIEISSET